MYVDALLSLLLPPPPLSASARIAALPNTMPTIGPGRLYQGTALLSFFLSSLAGGVVPAAAAPATAVVGGVLVKRTFRLVVPAASTLTGGTSCTASFVTPSAARTLSIL